MGVGTGTDVDNYSYTVNEGEQKGSYRLQKHSHTVPMMANHSSNSSTSTVNWRGAYGQMYTGQSGDGSSQNIMPYIGVYMWQRTA